MMHTTALTPEIRRCIRGAAIAFVLAEAARKRGDGEEAEQQETSAEEWCQRLVAEARANIRAGRSRLAVEGSAP